MTAHASAIPDLTDYQAARVLRRLANADPSLTARISVLAQEELAAAAAHVERYAYRPEPTAEQKCADLEQWMRSGIPPAWAGRSA
jgi:hypothetical protein